MKIINCEYYLFYVILCCPLAPSVTYEVLATDYESYSCTYSCINIYTIRVELFWIFTREKVLSDYAREKCITAFEELDVDTSKLEKVEQDDSVCLEKIVSTTTKGTLDTTTTDLPPIPQKVETVAIQAIVETVPLSPAVEDLDQNNLVHFKEPAHLDTVLGSKSNSAGSKKNSLKVEVSEGETFVIYEGKKVKKTLLKQKYTCNNLKFIQLFLLDIEDENGSVTQSSSPVGTSIMVILSICLHRHFAGLV